MNNILIREYSYWSTHPTETAACVICLFLILATTIGILTVSFTAPKTMSMFLHFQNLSR